MAQQQRASFWQPLTAVLSLLLAAIILCGLMLTQFFPPAQQASQKKVLLPRTCLSHKPRACLDPTFIRTFYGLDPLIHSGITGKGRTAAIIVSFGSPTLRADLHSFDRAFGLPDPHLDIAAPLGTRHPQHTIWALETTMDVEWLHAMAPNAHIVVLESPVDETQGVQGLPEFLTLERYAVDHYKADVVSQSWGATEETLQSPRGHALITAFHRFYAEASAKGTTFVAATGDFGASGLDLSLHHFFSHPAVSFPASDPLVLAVGGTRILDTSNPEKHGEQAWSGSGGGVSSLFAEPSYQRSLPLSVQQLLHGQRGLPDVAATADSKSAAAIYLQGHWLPIGGTSLATPLWAGIVTLADQKVDHRLGAINSTLYRLAQSPLYLDLLQDVTTGSNLIMRPDGQGVQSSAFFATRGWDRTTGLGSPHAAALASALMAPKP